MGRDWPQAVHGLHHRRLRRPSTWFFAVLLIVLPLVVLQALSNEPQHLNSPLSTATAVALIAMVGMLITAAIARRLFVLLREWERDVASEAKAAQ